MTGCVKNRHARADGRGVGMHSDVGHAVHDILCVGLPTVLVMPNDRRWLPLDVHCGMPSMPYGTWIPACAGMTLGWVLMSRSHRFQFVLTASNSFSPLPIRRNSPNS